MKTLIIRSDKLGDLYISIPFINALKRNLNKKNIDLLISDNIYLHFSSKKYLFENIYSFPKKGFLNKLSLIFKLRKKKYDLIIILDGKDRSLILLFFLKFFRSIILFNVKKFNTFAKYFLSNKRFSIITDNKVDSYLNLHNKILEQLNIHIENSDFSILTKKNISSLNFTKNLTNKLNNYSLLHLDEKWFSKFYINEYFDISPTLDSFLIFIKEFILRTKQNFIITTGLIELPFINEIKDKFFVNIGQNLYEYEYKDYKVFLFLKNSIEELEIISMNANNIITCNGPISQIAGSFNIRLFDIIDKSREKWYDRHTYHIKNYNKLFRKNFTSLSKEILEKI